VSISDLTTHSEQAIYVAASLMLSRRGFGAGAALRFRFRPVLRSVVVSGRESPEARVLNTGSGSKPASAGNSGWELSAAVDIFASGFDCI
jgi:hypothetical protein